MSAELIDAVKALLADVQAIKGYWTEGLDNSVQRVEQALKDADNKGALGLPYGLCGAVLQEVADALIDRGHDRDEVIESLTSDIDSEFWDEVGGPAVDWLEERLDLELIS